MLAQIVRDVFMLGVPVLEKVLRTALVYLFVLGMLRLAGKRTLAQLNPFDLVVLLLLSNVVQNAIIGDDNSFTGAAVGVVMLIGLNHLVVRFFYRHQRLERVIEGTDEPALIAHGQINREELRRHLITVHELAVAAHKQGFDSLREVEWADLDGSGALVFRRREPTADECRHAELLARLDALTSAVTALAAASGAPEQQRREGAS